MKCWQAGGTPGSGMWVVSKGDKEKCKVCSLRRKRTLGNVLLEPSPVLKELQNEEKPKAKCNQGTRTQDNTAPQIILHLRNRNSYAAKEKQLVKAHANGEGQVLSPAVSEWNLASGVHMVLDLKTIRWLQNPSSQVRYASEVRHVAWKPRETIV